MLFRSATLGYVDPTDATKVENFGGIRPGCWINALPVGGLVLFSAAQMHSSVPNTSGVTRFSIDFRTVHLDDVIERNGAPNIDSACTGTVMRDFMRGTDLTRLPEDIVAMYDDGTAVEGELIYMPKSA